MPLVGHLAKIPSDSVPEAELEAVKACKDFSPPLHFLHTIILVLHQGCPLDQSPLSGQTSDRALRLQRSQVTQVVGWFPAMAVLSQGEFCLLVSNLTNGIFYLSVRDLTASTVTHLHRNLEDEDMTE